MRAKIFREIRSGGDRAYRPWPWWPLWMLALWLGAGSPANAAPAPVRVSAASSLQQVLGALASSFATQTGAPRPTLAFAASSTLARQRQHGAPADLIITADAAWMDELVREGLVAEGSRVDVAHNTLVIVVPVGADDAPAGVADLAAPRFARVAVAGESVPAGRRAREALQHAGVLAPVTPRLVVGRNVRSALALVAAGAVDAGLVYRSDALASTAVSIAAHVPAAAHRPIVYPMALTAEGTRSPDARHFAAFIRGPEARATWLMFGFGGGEDETASTPFDAAPSIADPLWRSLLVAALSLTLSVVPAIALGWLLARREFIGKSIVSTALLAPLVLPPVVVGFVLLEALGRTGPLGPVLAWLGWELAFTRAGAVIAAAVVGFPLLVLMSRLAIEAVDVRYEQIAQTLGLTAGQAFVRVTLPMAAPGLAAGCVLAYARALGEFGATAVLASDIPGQTRTLALAIFSLYEQPGGRDAAHQLVWISIGLCAVALVGFEWLGRVQKRRLNA